MKLSTRFIAAAVVVLAFVLSAWTGAMAAKNLISNGHPLFSGVSLNRTLSDATSTAITDTPVATSTIDETSTVVASGTPSVCDHDQDENQQFGTPTAGGVGSASQACDNDQGDNEQFGTPVASGTPQVGGDDQGEHQQDPTPGFSGDDQGEDGQFFTPIVVGTPQHHKDGNNGGSGSGSGGESDGGGD